MLEERNWSSLILHDWERIPHGIDSDIDYVIRGPKPKELIHALIGYCDENGWRLVQILEHEVDAHYCVCVKNSAPFEPVLLDVCWDYRRKGIDLIRNDVLFEGAWQPSDRNFRVPAPQVEFLYRMIKSAAKAKNLESLPALENKMRGLFEAHSNECLKILVSLTGYQGGNGWDEVRSFFDKSSYFNKIRGGRKIAMRELKLYTKRMMNPTGLLLSYDEKGKSISNILETVSNAFRKVVRAEENVSTLKIRSHLIRSTLVAQVGRRARNGIYLSREEGSCEEIGVEKILDFLATRIKTQWNFRK